MKNHNTAPSADISDLLRDQRADPAATPMSGEAAVQYRPAPSADREKLADFLRIADREYWDELNENAPHIKSRYREIVAGKILDYLASLRDPNG